jgi:integrase
MTWTRIERGIVMREGRYYVRYQVSGRTVTEVTSARSIVQARAERAIRHGRVHDDRHILAHKKRVTLSDLLDGLVRHWRTAGADGGAIDTLATRSQQLEIVRRALGARRAREWTYQDAANYVALGTTQAQRGTRSGRMAMLRAAFNVALRDGLVDKVPPFPERIDNVRQGFLTPEEFQHHLSAFIDGVDAQILAFAYRSGQRIQRILDLHVTDVDTVEWMLKGEPERGNKARPWVPLFGVARLLAEARIRVAQGPGWLLFHRNGQPISRHAIHHKWRALMKVKGQSWTIHDFRRSCARNLVNAGVDSAVAMRITGHKSISMFTRYAINPNEAVKRGAQQLEAYLESRTGAARADAKLPE